MKKRRIATVTVELVYHDGGPTPSVQEVATFVQDAIQKHRYNADQGGAIAYGDYTVTNVSVFPPRDG